MSLSDPLTTLTFTADGEQVAVSVGDVAAVSNGIRLTADSPDLLGGYVVEAIEPTTGRVMDTVEPDSNAGQVGSDGTLTISPPGAQVQINVRYPVDGSVVASDTIDVSAAAFRAENVVLSVEELTSGPYPARPWTSENPNLLEYRFTVRNENGPQTPTITLTVAYPQNAADARTNEQITLAGGESATRTVTYGSGQQNGTLAGEGVCVDLLNFDTEAGERLDWQNTACLDVAFQDGLAPGDITLGGELNTNSRTGRAAVYGGSLYRKAFIRTGSLPRGATADIRYVERVRNVDAGTVAVVVDKRFTLGSNDDVVTTELGGTDVPFPPQSDEPFTLRHEREVYILDGPYADPSTPAVEVVDELTAPAEPSGQEDDDQLPPSVTASCGLADTEVGVGESVTVPVTITARGGNTSATREVVIAAAGETVTEIITVSGGDTRTVEAVFQFTEPGDYNPTVSIK